jgi:hypothetical protein
MCWYPLIKESASAHHTICLSSFIVEKIQVSKIMVGYTKEREKQ